MGLRKGGTERSGSPAGRSALQRRGVPEAELATGANPPLLSVHTLGKSFRGVNALDSVDLRVHEGERVGLIGPNGCGKTTLLNLVSGFVKPDAGRVSLKGVDITGRTPSKVARLGVRRTFQQPRLFHEMSTSANITVGALAAGKHVTPSRLDSCLALMDLEEVATAAVGQLSFGHQRRVELARAVAGEPKLLLLDEPAAGLNVRETERLIDGLKGISQALGCGMLIVEHDMRVITELCSKVYVLAEGRNLFVGNASSLKDDPHVVEAYLGTSATRRGTTPSAAPDGPASSSNANLEQASLISRVSYR